MPKKKVNDICQWCLEPFQEREVLIQYFEWNEKARDVKMPLYAHADCVLQQSMNEPRKYKPPISRPQK